MANKVCTIILIITLSIILGCQNAADTGVSRQLPNRTASSGAVTVAEMDEISLVEEIYANRQAYRTGLQSLISYYKRTNNVTKLDWAQTELDSLDTMRQYSYIVPTVTLPEGGANTTNLDADLIYEDALILEEQARVLNVIVDDNTMLRALRKYEDLITRYPNSDKVDDAAFRAGVISEHFKEYLIAYEFYKGAYQVNPDIDSPARFRAARILDQRLHRNDEALQLYQEAIETEGRYGKNLEWKNNAEERIRELQKLEQ